MATATAVNPYAELNRRKKIDRIVVFLWARLSPGERKNPDLPWTVAERPEAWWWDLAKAADVVNPTSDETRKLVVTQLCRWVTAERAGATAPCVNPRCMGGSIYAGNGDELTCPDCIGFSARMCENCGDAPATVVTPLGHYDERCARRHHPEVL
jgi:hypothetical protein